MAVSVSASMIVRNEEDGITQALASLQQIAALDEIVIIDTGSEDATVELARAEGATVHREPWQRDFSYHRNRCLDLCHNDWVFILDGDEVLRDVGHLDEFYAAPSGDGLAMNVSCVGVTDVVETFLSVRSFDRRAGRWQFPVHNQLVGLEAVSYTDARITATYDGAITSSVQARLPILLEHAEHDPTEPHYPLYLAKSYRILGDFEGLQPWASRYLALRPTDPMGAQVWLWLAEAALERGDESEAARIVEQGILLHPEFPDLHHVNLTMAAKRWFMASMAATARYATVPCRTRQLARELPKIASTLGLALDFKVDR